MEQLEKLLRERCPELELRVNEPMAKHTTFRIGGPAALMALPQTLEEAAAAVRAAQELGIEAFFLGNGSNLLVPDEGVDGFLIKTAALDGYDREGDTLTAWAGITLAKLAAAAQREGLAGLEFASGIPGSVGGAVTMNAGAYGGEIAKVLEEVTFLDEGGEVCTLPASECGFGYRKSIFSQRKCLILKARFRLEQGDGYAIKARMDELTAQRKAKQPIDLPSAGSMFKRPPGYFAAALIDQCGLKGLTVGGAQVSEKHAGFVVNRGGATCADVLELVRQVKERVLQQTGVELEMEVKVLDVV